MINFLAIASSSTLDSIVTSSSEPTSFLLPTFEQEKLDSLAFDVQSSKMNIGATISQSRTGSFKSDKLILTTQNDEDNDSFTNFQQKNPPAVPPRNINCLNFNNSFDEFATLKNSNKSKGYFLNFFLIKCFFKLTVIIQNFLYQQQIQQLMMIQSQIYLQCQVD